MISRFRLMNKPTERLLFFKKKKIALIINISGFQFKSTGCLLFFFRDYYFFALQYADVAKIIWSGFKKCCTDVATARGKRSFKKQL